jgi:hypothetical protein
VRGESELREQPGLLPIGQVLDTPGVSPELLIRAQLLWDAMARDPESEAFGGPEWKDLDPMVRRFAARTLSLIDPADLSDTNEPPRARLFCRHCRDIGLVFGEFLGTKDNPGCVSPATGRRETVVWFCMECPRGLRRCAAFWSEKNKYRSGERDYLEWMKANPVEARRVDAVDRSQEGNA